MYFLASGIYTSDFVAYHQNKGDVSLGGKRGTMPII
jgi:hypothetical protein